MASDSVSGDGYLGVEAFVEEAALGGLGLYTEPDICRSVDFGAEELLESHLGAEWLPWDRSGGVGKPLLPGCTSEAFGSVGTDEADDDFLPPPPPRPVVVAGSLPAAMPRAPGLFSPGDRPARVSSTAPWHFAPTTLLVQTSDPVSIGDAVQDCCYDCFGTVPLPSSDPSAFFLEAEVVGGCVECKVRFQLLELAPCEFTLELQRRRGDAVLFGEVFRKTREYLSKLTNCSVVLH